MDLPSIAFLALFIVIMVFFVYVFLTKRGQKELVDLTMNTTSAVLVGELPDIEFTPKFSLLTIKQKLKLYKCDGDSGPFYVLELTQNTIGSINRQFVKLSPEMASKLKALLQNIGEP